MKSYYNGKETTGAKWHLVQYFDGRRIRELSVKTYDGIICWTERNVPGAVENGIKYTTAKRRLAAIETSATRRIG